MRTQYHLPLNRRVLFAATVLLLELVRGHPCPVWRMPTLWWRCLQYLRLPQTYRAHDIRFSPGSPGETLCVRVSGCFTRPALFAHLWPHMAERRRLRA